MRRQAVTIVDPNPIAERAFAPHIAGAKQRIIDAATRLFYEEGIRTVGVDRIISEAGVTKATFYKHYGAKDRLIIEYLKATHDSDVNRLVELKYAADDPMSITRDVIAELVEDIQSPGFRGCPFINAAAEYSDPGHPVREVIRGHRDWYSETATILLRAAGHPMPGDAADDLLLARDGAMAAAYTGDSISAVAALKRVTDRILREVSR